MLAEADAADEEDHAEDEKEIGEDGAEEGRLDELELALDEGDDGDDQLGGVSESRVEETAEGLADAQGEFFGAEGEKAGEREDGEEGKDEDDGVVELGKVQRPTDLRTAELVRAQEKRCERTANSPG